MLQFNDWLWLRYKGREVEAQYRTTKVNKAGLSYMLVKVANNDTKEMEYRSFKLHKLQLLAVCR